MEIMKEGRGLTPAPAHENPGCVGEPARAPRGMRPRAHVTRLARITESMPGPATARGRSSAITNSARREALLHP